MNEKSRCPYFPQNKYFYDSRIGAWFPTRCRGRRGLTSTCPMLSKINSMTDFDVRLKARDLLRQKIVTVLGESWASGDPLTWVPQDVTIATSSTVIHAKAVVLKRDQRNKVFDELVRGVFENITGWDTHLLYWEPTRECAGYWAEDQYPEPDRES